MIGVVTSLASVSAKVDGNSKRIDTLEAHVDKQFDNINKRMDENNALLKELLRAVLKKDG